MQLAARTNSYACPTIGPPVCMPRLYILYVTSTCIYIAIVGSGVAGGGGGGGGGYGGGGGGGPRGPWPPQTFGGEFSN